MPILKIKYDFGMTRVIQRFFDAFEDWQSMKNDP